jgi:nitrogen PTS system EIIA component
MNLSDLLSPDAILGSLRVPSKKQVLHEMSERAAALCGMPAREIFDALLQRERLGSTGIGGGIAIPHGKIKVDRMVGVFARLEKPIDFEALDGEPVDLVLLLVTPESAGADHLKALARAARLLRTQAITAQLRATRDPARLRALLIEEPHCSAA